MSNLRQTGPKWLPIAAAAISGVIALGVGIGASGTTPAAAPAPVVSAQPKAQPTTPKADPTTAAPKAQPKKAEPTKEKATAGELNALRSAENYLDLMGFSAKGLAKQLAFEDYSKSEIAYAMDHVDADWMAEVEESAQSYMDTMPFSRSGLITQLKFDGYTTKQAKHGADSVGL